MKLDLSKNKAYNGNKKANTYKKQSYFLKSFMNHLITQPIIELLTTHSTQPSCTRQHQKVACCQT